MAVFPCDIRTVTNLLAHRLKRRTALVAQDGEGSFPFRPSSLRRIRRIDLTNAAVAAELDGYLAASGCNVMIALSDAAPPPACHHSNLYPIVFSRREPYVLVHDNDHAWFSGFSVNAQKLIFEHWMEQAAFVLDPGTVSITELDWRRLRRQLFQSGWSIDGDSCSRSRSRVSVGLHPSSLIPLDGCERDPRHALDPAPVVVEVVRRGKTVVHFNHEGADHR